MTPRASSLGGRTFAEEPRVAFVSSQVDAERDELHLRLLLPALRQLLHQLSITGDVSSLAAEVQTKLVTQGPVRFQF